MVLNPRSIWENLDDYDRLAAELTELFVDNFKIYGDAVSHLECAGPGTQQEVSI